MTESNRIKIGYPLNSQPVIWKDRKNGEIAIAVSKTPGNRETKFGFPHFMPLEAYWLNGSSLSGFPPQYKTDSAYLLIYFGNQLATGDINEDGQDELIVTNATGHTWIFNHEGDELQGFSLKEYPQFFDKENAKWLKWPVWVGKPVINTQPTTVMAQLLEQDKFDLVNAKGEQLPGYPVQLEAAPLVQRPVFVDSQKVYIMLENSTIEGIELATGKKLPNFPAHPIDKPYSKADIRMCLFDARKSLAVSSGKDFITLVDFETGQKNIWPIAGGQKINGVTATALKQNHDLKEFLYVFDEGRGKVLRLNKKGEETGSISIDITDNFENYDFQVFSPPDRTESYIFIQLFRDRVSQTAKLFDEWVGPEEAKKIEDKIKNNMTKHYGVTTFNEDQLATINQSTKRAKNQYLEKHFRKKYREMEYTNPSARIVVLKDHANDLKIIADEEIENYIIHTPDSGPYKIVPSIYWDPEKATVYYMVPLNSYRKNEIKDSGHSIVRVLQFPIQKGAN